MSVPSPATLPSILQQPLNSAMATFRKALLAAFKSFLRGRAFLQALFAFWVSPNAVKEHYVGDSDSDDDNAAQRKVYPTRSLEEFLKEAEQILLGRVEGNDLQQLSQGIKTQLKRRLRVVGENMLPSFSHLLPTGQEKGQYLALDVGGSTLRVALVELRGREATGQETEIARMDSFKITPDIKKYEGMAFFNWMAARIREVLPEELIQSGKTIPMGLAWSFPVEQTSFGGGRLLGMGKGFLATVGLEGQDLGEIIREACKMAGMDIKLGAIVNDGSATLLSQAYVHASTRFGMILGTGTNAAVHMPVSAFSRDKFGSRPDSWFQEATHVIVNTELSMFGGDALPLTRWDNLLNAEHPRPDFQPLEHFVAGFYLGEICRLAIVEAVSTTGVFGGQLPASLEKPYSLDTEMLSRIEADTSSTLEKSISYFAEKHPSTIQPTYSDISFLRRLASLISRRAAAVLASSIFALWELRQETEAEADQSVTEVVARKDPKSSVGAAEVVITETEVHDTVTATKVAFNGSVIEHYPGFRPNCQAYLNDLIAKSEHPGSVELVLALESSIMGAAVALACVAPA